MPSPLTRAYERAIRRDKLQRLREGYEFSSVQIDLPPYFAQAIMSLFSVLPVEKLHKIEQPEPHVTVRYGLQEDSVDSVKRVLGLDVYTERAGRFNRPAEVRLGDMGMFCRPDFDVLFVSAHSADLNELNARLGNLPHVDTQAHYRPHVTVAYLKPGTAWEWATRGANSDFMAEVLVPNWSFWSDEVTFSPRGSGIPTKIPLCDPATAGRYIQERPRFLDNAAKFER